MPGEIARSFLSPMQWRRQFEAELGDGAFDAAVNELLDDINAASSYQARMALVASFGGFMRAHRSRFWQRLGQELMHRLEKDGLVATQTVACVVMRVAFGEADTTQFLQMHFALPGRNARTKHVAAARAALAGKTDLVGGLCRALRLVLRSAAASC